ncbi:hypothetical protein HK405_010813, partial [Cladochytrium tenue]
APAETLVLTNAHVVAAAAGLPVRCRWPDAPPPLPGRVKTAAAPTAAVIVDADVVFVSGDYWDFAVLHLRRGVDYHPGSAAAERAAAAALPIEWLDDGS